ncbi:hypothetical protein SAMD00019534_042770 [Acytostelium subglobosum LB1]|uniref:hypothetical protein n=1 Tax=Acytostelium subglobosum LB1 TaxID=1410327 RepID=UPI000644F738|nr:hypothetical protein SAMD00019534_042770 [Acytostelium subglobosum LB1]GAM21102.1 hypothetical protein SAMD00019534_042770 [Acytostelium subglobosum LB1]|eukprot:XP_012756236.1 hypothetical protein SAMD00019534_042770 [Acytostelium subglobosum LB1]
MSETTSTSKYQSIQGSKQQENLYRQLALLTRIQDNNVVSHLVHLAIDKICGKTIVDAVKSIQLDQQLITLIIDVLQLFVSKVVGRDLKREHIIEDLKTARVQEAHANIVADCIQARYQDIKRELTEQLTSISSSSLTDFDWKMNLILSSDKINSVQESVLMLNLSVDHHTDKKEQLLVELTKKDLDQLLSTFDQINSVVQSLKV